MSRKQKKNVLMALDTILPVAVAVVFALIGYILFLGPRKADTEKSYPPVTVAAPAAKHAPIPSQTTTAVAPATRTVSPPPPAARPPAHRARVAIVIDDLGSDMAAIERVLEVDAPLSIAVLPGLAYSRDSALKASSAGRDVLLHLPMQPRGDSMKGLGPGALMVGMDNSVLAGIVEDDLESVPGVVGVNNHMGSYMTEDSGSMSYLMDVLHRHGLFFVDSRTSAASVALDAARKRGVPAAGRKVFLDDADDPTEIRRQFDRMVALSLRDGSAIAIGHPRPATLRVLADALPGLKEKSIEVVRVSRLVR